MRGMTEYQEAEREAKKEARKEASRTEAAPGSESRAGAAEEQFTRRTPQAVPKHAHASASKGELGQKKTRKESEVVALTQVYGIIPYGTKK